MKSLFASFVFFLAFCLGSFSQVITDSAFVHHQIVTGVLQAPYIFEGEVLTTVSYYSPNHDFIYTSNTVRVNQAWKENDKAPFKRDEIVEVITRGGTVGDNTLWITHQIGFVPGQKGMFLCSNASFPTNPNSSTPQARNLMLFDGLYFDFDYSKHYISVSYANINFDCLEKLYEILDPTFIAESLGVYPNPTSDLVTLEFELSQNSIMKFSVLDQLGREVINQSEIKRHIEVNIIPLNISKLRSGIYMVQVLNDESQIVSKLMV